MFRKMFRQMLMCAVALLLAGGAVYAANPAVAEVSFRCTVVLSAALIDGASSYDFGDVTAGTTKYAETAIRFYNDSSGAICKWDLNVDTRTCGWQVAAVPGLNQFALYGVFKSSDSAPVPTDFTMGADSLGLTAKEYSDAYYTPVAASGYETDGYNDQCKVLPKTYADSIGKRSERALWLKLLTPIAVAVANEDKKIYVNVTAKLSGE